VRITFKLYASLGEYLPPGARDHKIELEVPEGCTPTRILEDHRVPGGQVHLVLVNGVYLAPAERNRPLAPGDELAVWPAIAGG
jgi:molybdopterin converting factor small subunit